jgi:DNA repair exonuclease SbcCD ATPase subunit
VRGLEEQVSNWTALGQHLGKDGLQKEEVSAAGPQLTEITNNLLRTAGDTRHTVSIETERLHSNKKQMIPCLDIMVFDSVEQISKESRRLSDAGKVLVGEPFSLALVVLGCQRAGIKSPTIFRDEATGVMDVANSGFYIGMLRGFAEMLDAHVLFISQNPAMWDLADSRVFIEAGKLRLE